MIGFDSETHRTTRSCIVPPLVCTSWYSDASSPYGSQLPDGFARLAEEYPDFVEVIYDGPAWYVLAAGPAAAESFRRAFAVRHLDRFVAHRAPYDLAQWATVVGVLPIMDMLDQGQVTDTDVRERLLSIAAGDYQLRSSRTGQFSLDSLTAKYTGTGLDDKNKDDDQRMTVRYHLLDGVPLSKWPDRAKAYALFDAKAAFDVWVGQAEAPSYAYDVMSKYQEKGVIEDEQPKVRDAFAIFLQSCYGPIIDSARGAQVIKDWDAIYQEGAAMARRILPDGTENPDWFLRDDGSRDMKRLAALVEADFSSRGLQAPMTEGGKKPKKDGTFASPKPSTAGDVLELCTSKVLQAWATADKYRNYIAKYAHVLQIDGPVTYFFNPIVATGRWSVSDPPYHGPPKKGGFREAHKARPGTVYVSTDYNQVELLALAYVCEFFGFGTEMADIIRAGVDLHTTMAVTLYRYIRGETVTYDELVKRLKDGDEVAKEMRTLAKAANFGFPGGLGPVSFVSFAWKQYKLKLTIADATTIRDAYRVTFPCVVAYQRHIGSLTELTGSFTAIQLVSGRHRGGCGYNDGCNTYFQGLAADGIREAIWRILRECFTPGCALYGSRLWLSIHDETLAEVPEDRLHEAATRISEIMVEAMAEFIPTIPAKAPPAAMRYWTKAAEPTYVDGRLVVWEPAC